VSVQKTLILAIALLLVVSTGATAASKRVNWTFSGSSIGGIALDEPSGCSMLLINVQAKGSPGSATVFGLNRDCPNPADGENSLVATFNDGSLLNAVVDPAKIPVIDFDPTTGLVSITFGIKFNGGLGRFSNATGSAEGQLYLAPVAPGSSLNYEFGTFKGMVHY
jgi:hypothetical protein